MLQRLLQILAAISGDKLAHRSWEWRQYALADTVPQELKDACGIKNGRRHYFFRLGPAARRKPHVKAGDRRQGKLPLDISPRSGED